MDTIPDLLCTFCEKTSQEVKKLIQGPIIKVGAKKVTLHICDGCVNMCYSALQSSAKVGSKRVEIDVQSKAEKPFASPRLIKQFLDQYVIGQDYAKDVLSVAVYNHYKRLENPVIDGVEMEKSNVLLFGPTGVGKTLLPQTVARMLEVPFAIVDATALTEAGYVGEDVESVVGRLLSSAGNSVEKAERGIIFIDEIDKKRSSGLGSAARDVSGEGVQQALLKLMEGSDVLVTPIGSKRNNSAESVKVSTRNILFIVAGAFVGLDKVVEKSLNKGNRTMGFAAPVIGSNGIVHPAGSQILCKVEPDHLVQFGLIPEFIGRLPIVAHLLDLGEQELVRVLTEPKNSVIKQMQALFRIEGVQLEFEPEALEAIAKKAKERKTNGRALRSVLETTLLQTQFKLPDLRDAGAIKVIVTAECITDGKEPEVLYQSAVPTLRLERA